MHTDDLSPPSAQWRALAHRLPASEWALLDRDREVQDQDLAGPAHVMLAIRQTVPSGADAFFMLHKAGLDSDSAASLSGLVQPLIGMLQPALEAVTRLRHLVHCTRQAERLLDSVRRPLLLLDASARVLAGNRQGWSLVCQSAVVPGRGAELMGGFPPEQLLPVVRRACGRDGPAAGSSLASRWSGSESDERLLILPAPPSKSCPSGAAALLMLVRADDQCNPATLLLQQLFGFTPAESRLASLILQGHAPAEAATRLRVGLATVRSQLSSLLRKAGASKQAELVRRLSPLMMVGASPE